MTNDSITRVSANMAAIKSYIDAQMDDSTQSVLGRTSEFWQAEFAGRPNYPTVSEFLAFRRGGFTQGMADGFSFNSKDAQMHDLVLEKAHARSIYEIFRHCADPDKIAALDEATLGAPFVFENHGVNRSAAFWTNAATTLRVKHFLGLRGLTDRPLDILEIGAGWGCVAHQAHQLLDINSYAIVDLPQNLFLSSSYLSSTLGRKLQFPQSRNAAIRAEPQSLLCALPGTASAIGQKYDAVVNTFSLQEMDLETVQGYFAWIADILGKDGVFISFNSHGKAGVRKPSDYPLEHFHLEHLGMFRNYPSGLLNTIPYEMVLSRRNGRPQGDPALLDVICSLLQFGLGDNMQVSCNDFVQQTMPPQTQQSLKHLSGYFSESPARRNAALAGAAATCPPDIHAYLRGMDAFVKGETQTARDAFEKALDGGIKGFARLRASAHLAILTGQKTLPKWDVDFDARLAYPELARMLDQGNTSQFIGQFERIVSVELPDPMGY